MPWIKSKFDGKCAECGDDLTAGENVYYNGTVYCAPCGCKVEEEDKKASVLQQPMPSSPFKSAQQVLDEIAPPKKKKKAKLIKERIVVCGAIKWTNRAKIKEALKRLRWQDIDAVITGSAKGVESLCQSVCKELKLPLIVASPNTGRWPHRTAYQFRNDMVFRLMKPSKVFIFDDDVENNYPALNYKRQGTRRELEVKVIASKGKRK